MRGHERSAARADRHYEEARLGHPGASATATVHAALGGAPSPPHVTARTSIRVAAARHEVRSVGAIRGLLRVEHRRVDGADLALAEALEGERAVRP